MGEKKPAFKDMSADQLVKFVGESVKKSTEWCVFEPNNEETRAKVQKVVEQFLHTLWRDGALKGRKPEEAYFVKVDRTTMTEEDLREGHMIIEVGLHVARTGEFRIIRVSQWAGQ